MRPLRPSLLWLVALVVFAWAPLCPAQVQYNWLPLSAPELPAAQVPVPRPGVHAYQVSWTPDNAATQTQVIEVPDNQTVSGFIGTARYTIGTQVVMDPAIGLPSLLTRLSVGMVQRSDLIGVGQFRTIATGLTRMVTIRRLN